MCPFYQWPHIFLLLVCRPRTTYIGILKITPYSCCLRQKLLLHQISPHAMILTKLYLANTHRLWVPTFDQIFLNFDLDVMIIHIKYYVHCSWLYQSSVELFDFQLFVGNLGLFINILVRLYKQNIFFNQQKLQLTQVL